MTKKDLIKGMRKERRISVGFSIEVRLNEQLKEFSLSEGVTRSAVVNQLLNDFFQNYIKAYKPKDQESP